MIVLLLLLRYVRVLHGRRITRQTTADTGPATWFPPRRPVLARIRPAPSPSSCGTPRARYKSLLRRRYAETSYRNNTVQSLRYHCRRRKSPLDVYFIVVPILYTYTYIYIHCTSWPSHWAKGINPSSFLYTRILRYYNI